MNLKEANSILNNYGYTVINEKVVNGKMPKYFYHGTAKRNIESIKQNGLKTEVESRNYSISNNCICLTGSKRKAMAWAQEADVGDFVVLKIDSDYIDPRKLELDMNMEGDLWNDDEMDPEDFVEVDFDKCYDHTCYSYFADIPKEAIIVDMSSTKGELIKKVEKIVYSKDLSELWKIWDSLDGIETSDGTLKDTVAKHCIRGVDVRSIGDIPISILNEKLTEGTFFEEAAEMCLSFKAENCQWCLENLDGLSDHNIEFIWKNYTKPGQRQMWERIKELGINILRIGKPYIAKKYYAEIGI